MPDENIKQRLQTPGWAEEFCRQIQTETGLSQSKLRIILLALEDIQTRVKAIQQEINVK